MSISLIRDLQKSPQILNHVFEKTLYSGQKIP